MPYLKELKPNFHWKMESEVSEASFANKYQQCDWLVTHSDFSLDNTKLKEGFSPQENKFSPQVLNTRIKN